MSNLEDLIHTVDGEKYSCHATSVLDINHVTDQMGAITVNPKMVRVILIFHKFLKYKLKQRGIL